VDRTAELAEMEDEPLSSQFPADYRIRTASLNNLLAECMDRGKRPKNQAPLEEAFDAVYADLSRKSRVPDGPFARHDRIRLQQEVIATGNRLIPLMEAMLSARQFFSAVTLGGPVEAFCATDDRLLRCDPATISYPGDEFHRSSVVTLSGQLPWVWQALDGTWHCLAVTGSGRRSTHADKYVLGPLLTCMALSAAGPACPWSGEDKITVHAVYHSRVIGRYYDLEPRRSAAYLSALLEDFFTPTPLLWLPFTTVFDRKELRALIVKDGIDPIDREQFCLILQAELKAAVDLQAELTGAVVTTDILDRARRRFRVFAA